MDPKSDSSGVIPSQKNRTDGFPIVGVGASAGGLKAFQKFLESLPAEPGLAIVLIPHLAPAHESMLSSILERSSKMPIREAKGELTVQLNHVYVIPPNTTLTFSRGQLHPLSPRLAEVNQKCIDHFLISLAQEAKEKAIAVVLSGTASDGAIGIKAVKTEGGITFAQDDSAEFPGMPTAAIATGAVDFILSPEAIAKELVRISRHPYLVSKRPETQDLPEAPVEEELSRVLRLLEEKTGTAFAQYKPPTVRRRVARRMAICQIERLGEYLKFLLAHPEEIRALHDDILVNVTSFFRDPESFQALKELVFSKIVERQSSRAPIRFWVPGCSTGEEPYSLAMAFLEYLEATGTQRTLQIFASDVSEAVLARARAGIYDSGIAQDLSAERIRRFFSPTEDGRYQISKRLREICLFARHDLAQDPPFSKIDLISCRNLLIYLGPELQKRIIPLLHYALNPAGFLMLGSSESVDRFGDLFKVIDRKHRLYSKVATAAQDPSVFEFPSDRTKLLEGPFRSGESIRPAEFDLGREIDRLIVRDYGPAGLVVSEDGQVLELRGDTAPYLRQAPGKPGLTLQKMIEPELLPEVESAIREARERKSRVRREPVEFRSEERLHRVALEVRPIPGITGRDQFYAVLFETEKPAGEPKPRPAPAEPSNRQELEHEIDRLRHALEANREYQQSIIERIENSNEELRSSHEEVLSSNEELQSTNEELETAKEELQSTNEELTTLNEELRHRNEELAQSNGDLANVLASVQIPIAIVDRDLRLRRVTPAGERLLNVIPTDINRRITDFKPNLSVENLGALLSQAVEKLTSGEQEVRDIDGRWYSLRVRPYRSIDDKIEGAVLTIVDIDAVKRIALENERARAFSETVIDSVPYAILVLDGRLRVERANEAFFALFRVTREETENRLLYEIGDRQWDIPELRTLLEKILPENSRLDEFEVTHDFPRIGKKTVYLHARKLTFWHTREPMIVLAIEDITQRLHAEREVRSLAATLEGRVRQRTSELESSKGEMEAFTYSVAHDLRAPLRAMHGFAQLLREDYRGRPLDQAGDETLGRIIDASAKMDALIQDLLAYSRLSRDGLPLETVDLEGVVDEVLKELGTEIVSRGAKVTVNRPLERVQGNRLALGQVVSNLLSNGLKFVPQGTTPQVGIRSETLQGQVRLWVEDNGIGIAPKHHERIFRVFERLNRADAYPGTGIGLAIVRKAVERMGGQVGLESEEGKGSRFFISLKEAREAKP